MAGSLMTECEMTFHHFGLLSSVPEASCQILADLGYKISEPIEDPLQNVRAHWATHLHLPSVEVISATDEPGPVSNLVERFKQGIYHLCFRVKDTSAWVERMSVHTRVMLVSPPKRAILFDNGQVSFHFVENFGLIELLEQNETAD
jgi:hypothetical protein